MQESMFGLFPRRFRWAWKEAVRLALGTTVLETAAFECGPTAVANRPARVGVSDRRAQHNRAVAPRSEASPPSPGRAHAVSKTSRLTGLWDFDLRDEYMGLPRPGSLIPASEQRQSEITNELMGRARP
jgi:hypothetical protein